MRVYTKIGDIFSVKIDENHKKYFQLIAYDLTQLNSDVIRAFKKEYPISITPNLSEVVGKEIDFYAHCVTKSGIKLNLWEKVGNTKEVGNTSQVLFRDTNDYGCKMDEEPIKVSNQWYISWFQMGQPFEVLDIEYNQSETKYFLIMHTFSHRKPVPAINRNTEKIDLCIYKKEISKKSVDLIKELFETAIKGAKFVPNEMVGLDGMSHYFFINENGVLKGGKIWSPNKRSKMRQLVNIGEQLIKLSKSNAEIVKFDIKLTKKIIDLTYELQ